MSPRVLRSGGKHGGCTYSGIEFDEDDELNLQVVQSGQGVLYKQFSDISSTICARWVERKIKERAIARSSTLGPHGNLEAKRPRGNSIFERWKKLEPGN